MYATQLPSLCDGGDDSQAELHNQVPMRIYPLGYEQMNTGWPFSLLNDEQMSNKVGVENQPAMD